MSKKSKNKKSIDLPLKPYPATTDYQVESSKDTQNNNTSDKLHH